MSAHPQLPSQRIVPYLCYADAPAAIDFLCAAFGFEERYRLTMPDGRLGHAELGYGGDALHLASVWPEMGFASPRDLPARHCQIHMFVDDVDAHFARAREAGATIAAEPEDQFYGDRIYRSIDPEGHRWIFAQRLREMSPAEMQARMDA